ncbi:MAG: CCA tRNA nucleotidyltransferase [Treponema sp.]|nr:CCA tRNA nucleotidyltransferase [Treponema sp.]
MKIPKQVKEAAAIFTRGGKQVYLVGGAVRDLLRGQKAKDWDLATDALPEEVIELFSSIKNEGSSFVVPTGIKHGTVSVHFKDMVFEVTSFRSEGSYSDGRRPDQVVYGVSIEEDLSRRDFTMNAAAYKLPAGPLVDPFDGRGDIKKGLIRSVGRAAERFAEDGLRPLRALRFASQLGFGLDDETLAAIPQALNLCSQVAPERLRDELEKIVSSPRPSAALLLMEKTGLLQILIPELAACRGAEQRGYHAFDVLDHSLLACDYAARGGRNQAVRLAALYHDIGKPRVARLGDKGAYTFYGHDQESALMTRNLMQRFRYSNAHIDRVCRLVEVHMFQYDGTWNDAAVRRFIIRVGEENLEDLYDLRRCDAYATKGIEPERDFLLPLQERVGAILAQSRAFTLKDLAVSGRDLIALGIAPGKHLGIILEELLEAVLDDPEQNTRAHLLMMAEKINQRYT